MSKIGIIGLGKVGSQVLTDVQNLNLFSDIVLIDTDTERASGEALDSLHTQGLPNSTHINIREGNYNDLTEASFIVITASVPTDPNEGDRCDCYFSFQSSRYDYLYEQCISVSFT